LLITTCEQDRSIRAWFTVRPGVVGNRGQRDRFVGERCAFRARRAVEAAGPVAIDGAASGLAAEGDNAAKQVWSEFGRERRIVRQRDFVRVDPWMVDLFDAVEERSPP
jgi:hypothetical protein